MSESERKIYEETRKAVEEVRVRLVAVQDCLDEAADLCGDPAMKDHLNSLWDSIEDVRFDLQKQVRAFHDRLNGTDAQRESWAETWAESFPKAVSV